MSEPKNKENSKNSKSKTDSSRLYKSVVKDIFSSKIDTTKIDVSGFEK